MLYDNKGNPKLYEERDLIRFGELAHDIGLKCGFIEAVGLEINSREPNTGIANGYVKELKKSIKKYKEEFPEYMIKSLISEKRISELEAICGFFQQK